jgi:murein DD-endopeptidase MepM/ murein hydrolase activator NlpD
MLHSRDETRDDARAARDPHDGRTARLAIDMHEAQEAIDGTPICETCEEPTGRGQVVQLQEPYLRIYCSPSCYRVAAREQWRQRWKQRLRSANRLAVCAVVFGAWVTPHEEPERHPVQVAALAAPLPAAKTAVAAGREALPDGWYGPVWPPTELSVLAALGRDAWVHPLAGPVRRMPRHDSRVFGAARPGNRPIDCRNGHCGVDLGGEIWGEHIRAVHDGVVDFVQRNLNPDHGGRFVRLSHRNGTLFTLYFHLAAIPRGLERGVKVKSGQVIGLLGDTGVKESAPHLHFAMTIRPQKDGYEKYIDPEPLVALWPLRVPVDGSEVGLVTTVAEPGVPLGSQNLRPGHKRVPPPSKKAAKGQGKPGHDPSEDDDSAAVGGRAAPADDAASEGESIPDSPSED